MRAEPMFHGATFKDFLFRPQYGVILSRTQEEIDLSMHLTRGVVLKGAPIVAANMRTVTGARMMKAMDKEGCFAFIHRRYSVDVQAEKVREVKNSQSYIIENPLVIHQKATIGEAKALIKKNKISGLLVEEKPGNRILKGILSRRDIPTNDDANSRFVCEFMTNNDDGDLRMCASGISMEEAERVMFVCRFEKLPLVDTNMKIQGLITMRDLVNAKKKPYTTKDDKGRLMAGATIGASRDYMERAEALVAAGVDVILMDIAHGHGDVMKQAILNFKSKFKDSIQLVAGNVATAEGAKFLAELGVDGIKIGVGPGKGCRTRLGVRFGVSQVQAIREAYLAVKGKVPIMADGGIEDDGDIVMALLGAGASTVMLGSMLAGTDEAPGLPDENGMKIYKGETSLEASFEDVLGEEDLEELMSEIQAAPGHP